MKYRRALVTGGAGFIGSHLARALLARGLEVTILDDLSMGRLENVPAGARFLQGDVRSREDVAAALEGVDIVFHEAARVSIRASLPDFYADADTNFMGTLTVLEGCASHRIHKLVFASSMAVYADSAEPVPVSEDYAKVPAAPYGIAKLAAESYCLQLARAVGFDCVVLRYFNTYGPGQTYTPYVGVITIFIRKLLAREQPIIFGDGEQRRDFIHVSDIVAANLAAMDGEVGAGIFNVGTGRSTSVNEIARLLFAKIAPDIAPGFAPAQPTELRNCIADIGRIETTLDFRPQQELSVRIDEIIAYHAARQKAS